MARGRSNFKMGTVELIVLFLLEKRDLYGHITDKEEPIGKRRVRVYYHLEDAGRSRLADLLEDYHTNRAGTDMILACRELPEGC